MIQWSSAQVDFKRVERVAQLTTPLVVSPLVICDLKLVATLNHSRNHPVIILVQQAGLIYTHWSLVDVDTTLSIIKY